MQIEMYHEVDVAIARECAIVIGAETGGVLIGETTSGRVIVHTATGPGPNAVCRPALLEWDSAYIQGVIDGVSASAVLQVVGRWHKHASPVILPSQSDRQSAEWFRQCVAPKGSTVELIVATGEDDAPMAIGVYECTCNGLDRIR